MTAIDSPLIANKSLPVTFPLVDTHTHFDAPVFDSDRQTQAQQAYNRGVRHLVLVGYLYRHFDRLYDTQQAFNAMPSSVVTNVAGQPNLYPKAHIALGLHPFILSGIPSLT